MLLDIPVPTDITENEARAALALKLFQDGKISKGKGADIAGMGYRDFWDLLVENDIPVVTYTEEDIMHDIEVAREFL